MITETTPCPSCKVLPGILKFQYVEGSNYHLDYRHKPECKIGRVTRLIALINPPPPLPDFCNKCGARFTLGELGGGTHSQECPICWAIAEAEAAKDV